MTRALALALLFLLPFAAGADAGDVQLAVRGNSTRPRTHVLTASQTKRTRCERAGVEEMATGKRPLRGGRL